MGMNLVNFMEIAVMEPKYQINLGYIARVSKNFGISGLILINPRCNYKGKEAIKYSKHAVDLLKKATIIKNIKELKAEMLIGSTGVAHKTNASYYNLYPLDRVAGMVSSAESSGRRVVLL